MESADAGDLAFFHNSGATDAGPMPSSDGDKSVLNVPLKAVDGIIAKGRHSLFHGFQSGGWKAVPVDACYVPLVGDKREIPSPCQNHGAACV